SRIRRIIIPDPWISWVPFAVVAGIREARRRGGFDAIVSSSPNESSHLAGWALAALLRVPWIADLRDPWWSNSRRTGRDGWIGRADAALGRLVLRRARHITTASAPWTEQIAEELPAVPVSFVMNGTADSTGPRDDPPADASTLVYTGLLHGRRQFSPPFLAAIRDANVVRAQRGAAPLTLEVYGPPSEDLAAAASDADASDVVRQHGVVERAEAIAAQRAAGAVVVVIGDNPTEVECLPAKLFEYISTGRPIVVLGPRENEAARLVEAHGLGVSASDEDIARLVEMLTSTTLQAARHDAPETAHELSQDRMACEFADTIAMIVDDDHRTRV
ncbi:MAG: glycosyltransferase, partial [Ilumatobacteraceae bacterium]